jgi:hypothetical protein
MVTLKSIQKFWNDFFFTPKPVEGVAVFRVLWCSMLLLNALFQIDSINDFYGPNAIVSFSTAKNQFPYPHLNIFQYIHVTSHFFYNIFGIYILSLILSIVGFYTKISLVVSFILLVSLHQRSIWQLSSSELLMRITMMYLIFSPSAHAYSIDSILARKRNKKPLELEWAPWAIRLIQIQLSVVYLWTFWHKLKGDTWFDGSALYYATRLESMKNMSVPFLLDSMPSIRLMSWGTLLIELSLGLFIWIKECRPLLIILGILFHLSIEFMMAIPFFEHVMILLLFTFVDPHWVRHTLHSSKEKVIYLFSRVQFVTLSRPRNNTSKNF